MKTASWPKLLEDDDFRRWHENLARGSTGTAVERARVLYRFLNAQGMTPHRLVDLAKQDRRGVEDLLSDFVGGLLEEGKSPGYVENYLKAVKSWLEYNEIRLVRRIKIGNRGATPTIDDERVPTADELRTILCYAGERARCSIGFIAFAGLRPGVLGNERGVDGLKVEDLPEMKIEDGRVSFTKIPPMVVVKANLSKIRKRYFTFLVSEGCDYLQAYLEKRIAVGEELTCESPIIAVTPGYEEMGKSPTNRGFKFIATKNVTREIREAIRPRFKWRPYVLRAYFDTQLLVAENHGKISHAYRQFFMGHKGDMEARYTTNKGRLPESVVEDMREAFRRSQEYLQTAKTAEASEEKLAQAFRKQLLLVAGFKQDEIAKLDLSAINDEELQGIVRKRLLGTSTDDCPKQKVVSIGEVESYLSQGWEYVANLPGKKVVIKLNS
jgi:hypothetical protein